MIEITASWFIPFLAELCNRSFSGLLLLGCTGLVSISLVQRHHDIPIALGYISHRKLGRNQHNPRVLTIGTETSTCNISDGILFPGVGSAVAATVGI